MLKPLFKSLLMLCSLGSISGQASENLDYASLFFQTQQLSLDVEIAATPTSRETGLMHRSHIDANQGMLFVFEHQDFIHVWMKNTHIPLDVIFVDSKGRIVALLKHLPPCHQDNCPIYRSNQMASFMLEVNAGFIDQHRITIGETIHLPF